MVAANLNLSAEQTRLACGGLGTGQWTRNRFVHSDAPCYRVICRRCLCDPNFEKLGMYDCLSSVSTGQLHPSQGFHIRPINHVFYMGSSEAQGLTES